MLMLEDKNKRPSFWMPRVGEVVDYHSVIGEDATETGKVVKHVGELPSGEPVAWLFGKRGCVAMDALTPKHWPLGEDDD